MNSQEIEYNRLGEEGFTKRGAVSRRYTWAWTTACWWRAMRSRDAWLGTITTSSTISSLPSTSGTARWNSSTACPTAWATSSSCARRTTASMTPVAGLPKTAGTSTTTTVSGRYCLEKVCKSIFFLSLYSAKITFCLLLDYLPILQHLPHELFGIWEQFVFSHLVICSKLFYPSMHALKCLAIST